MIGLAKWNATLLGTLFGALVLNALSCSQSTPRGRSLSELSLYLKSYTEPGNYHSGRYQTRDNDIEKPNYHYHRPINYNRANTYERKVTSDDHAYKTEGRELAPVHKNSLCNKCKLDQMQSVDVYRNANKMKHPVENDFSTYLENHHLLKIFSSNGKLPFGCTHRDFLHVLSNKQILKKVTYVAFDISLRKAFIGYYYFIIYLNRCYYSMVNKMSTWFMNVANSRNIPNDVRLLYWRECRKNLIKDLEVIEAMSKNYFDTFIARDFRVWIVNYELCLERCRKLWKKAILNNRVKWSRILSSWIVKYNQEMKLREEERRRWKSRDDHSDGEHEGSDHGNSNHRESNQDSDLISW